MDIGHIRNFCIIAHIDHGKSTLADRMLEMTSTVEKRKMKEQVLDSMDLERERGITIKMQPVRMIYKVNHTETLSSKSETLNESNQSTIGQDLNSKNNIEFSSSGLEFSDSKFILNLIDTPGHIDFSYEVSRALKAVEGAVLLVDATQGVQAQTLTVLSMAQDLGLVIIPAVNKIDSPLARTAEVKEEISKLLSISADGILEVSGKTGEGVKELLSALVADIPSPKLPEKDEFRSLVFDFQYDNHRGVIVFVRVIGGSVSKSSQLLFKVANKKFNALEVGIFSPGELPVESLGAGEIGYIVTGIKEPGIASVGDTIADPRGTLPALAGYEETQPVVWASVYPESQDDFVLLRQALGRLRLSDSSLSFEEESSGSLGRGFRCGFLGMLHLEIVTERLRREAELDLVVTTPSITYEVTYTNGKKETVYSPSRFPDDGVIAAVREPWVRMKIITPSDYISPLMQILYDHEAELGDSETWSGERTALVVSMPLREMMRGFFDEIKSATSGFASISYEVGEMRDADVSRLDIIVADEVVPAFSRVVSRRRVEQDAEKAVERLHTVLPRQMFATKIQGKALGRIISSKTLPALKKNVTGHLYGGDITRKRKLWEKQKKGKKKLKDQGSVTIPNDVFLKMMKSSD